MKKTVLLIVALLLLFSVVAVAKPVDYVTKKCVFYVQFDRLEQLFSTIGNYARRLGIPWQGRQIKAMFSYKLFGMQNFPGISLNRPIGLMVYTKGAIFSKRNASLGVMLPMTSRSAFRRYVLPIVRRFARGGVYYRGRYAFAAVDRFAAQQFLRGQRKRITLVNGAQLNYYIDLSAFEATIGRVMNKIVSRSHNQDAATMQAVRMVKKLYSAIFAHIKGGTFSIGLSGKGLEFGCSLPLKQQKALAKFLREERSSKIRSLSILPADCLAVFGVNQRWMGNDELYKKYAKWYLSLYKNEKERANYKKLMMAQVGRYTGDYSAAMVATEGKGLGFVMANRLKPGVRDMRLISIVVDYINNMPEVIRLAKKGVVLHAQYRKGAENYDGTSIHVMNISISSQKPLFKDKPHLLAFLKKLLHARIAYAGGYELVAFGTDSQKRIRELIRNASGRSIRGAVFSNSATYRKLRRLYGMQQKNLLFYGSMSGIIREIMNLAASFEVNERTKRAAAMLNRILPRRAGNGIFGYGYLSSKGIQSRILFARDEIMALFRLFNMVVPKEKKSTDR